MAQVRQMIPTRAHPKARWEISDQGRVIGWIDLIRIGHASADFYDATGVHPVSGKLVSLEASTDFENRVEKILELHQNPERTYGIHWH